MFTRSLTRPLAALGVALALAGCSGAASPPTQNGGGGSSSAGSSVAGSSEPAAAGTDGFEGTLTSSGIYSAAWTVPQGTPADPFNSINNPTLSSDKGTFGNIRVGADGKVSFGSAASELNQNSSYDGTGAKVTLDASGQFVCAFTVDIDLTGNHDAAILHMSGGMKVHWQLGAGGVNCP